MEEEENYNIVLFEEFYDVCKKWGQILCLPINTQKRLIYIEFEAPEEAKDC